MRHRVRQVENERGVSVLELLIAVVITAIVVGATLEFYVTEHNAWLQQNDVSETQQNLRVCLDEIATVMRMAGYGLDGHPAIAIGFDSVAIYYNKGGSVDTVLYFVQHDDERPAALLRQNGHDQPEIYADGIEQLNVRQVSPSLVELELVGHGFKEDYDLLGNDGLRRRSAVTSVLLRNLTI